MAEEIDFENGRNSNFEGLVTLTLTFDPAIPHTVVHHSSTCTYIPNVIQIEETFCGRTDVRTDVRTYGRTDISPLYIIRSTFGSRPKKDIDLLETVQQRATRLMTSDKSLSYTDQLQKFGLTTLETRKLQSDLIEVFKMFK